MTYQEANALVDDFSFVYKGKSIPKEALIECREVIHKALKKQIPKKPLKQECDFFDFNLVCPECKNRIVNVWSKREYKPNYCHYCGQALDWSGNNG
nr:MAG TPA: LysW biosynthesis protein LysW [Caudoviricetes sp.]